MWTELSTEQEVTAGRDGASVQQQLGARLLTALALAKETAHWSLFAKLDSAEPTGPREKEQRPCFWQPGQPLGAQEPTQSQGPMHSETQHWTPGVRWRHHRDSASLCVGQAQCEAYNRETEGPAPGEVCRRGQHRAEPVTVMRVHLGAGPGSGPQPWLPAWLCAQCPECQVSTGL